jgi:hypothetical protein
MTKDTRKYHKINRQNNQAKETGKMKRHNKKAK